MSTFDVENVIENLTTQEKVSLLTGIDYWSTYAIPRLNVPSIRSSDGPNGIRGQHHFNSTPTSTLPVGTALGATWSKELLYDVGKLLDKESRAKGIHLLLAPTVNIQRIPNGGRGFESFAEDPLLSGTLAAAYINGYQEKGLAATIKHFVGNDQETERFSSNSIISERALREIYLKPFEIVIKKSNPKSVMTSYNRVNGKHVSENPLFLDQILRKEWNWKGLVISDWTGTFSTSDAINAGLDLEMPGPGRWRGDRINHSLLAKTITHETLDERVRNILNLVKDVQASGVPSNAPELEDDSPEDHEFLRKVAGEAVVLLKNSNKVLPFKKDKKILVIGPNATYAAYSGGGSALATPYYTVSPIQAINDKIGKENVTYEVGAYNHKYLPALTNELFIPNSPKKNGSHIEFFNEPIDTKDRKPFDIVDLTNINYFRLNDYAHPDLKSGEFYLTIKSIFIPENDGEYQFGLASFGTSRLFIDDVLVVDNATHQTLGESFYGLGTIEEKNTFKVVKGKKYDLRVEFGSAPTSKILRKSRNSSFFGGGGLRFGGTRLIPDEEAIKTAVEQAGKFDQVVIITGLNQDYESEAADREDLHIPGLSNRLIDSVLDVNPNAAVVIQSGTPVELPWVSKAKTLLYSSYGGNETGSAIADTLFGDENPSGKLPITFPIRFEDTPSYINNTTYNGRVLYGEDVFVGYRYYERVKRDVLFPFGYGLSYTEFELTQLTPKIKGNNLHVSVNVKNVGEYDGSIVVQLYVKQSFTKFRPVKELRDFHKEFIKVGKSTTVEFDLELDEATAYFDEEIHKWVSLEGDYELFVGQSSDDRNALVTKFTVPKTTRFLKKLL